VKLPSFKRSSVPPDERIPRGAIAVVAVGLLATIAAALLTGGGSGGGFAHLEWVQQGKIPDSKAVEVPANKGIKMQLINGRIQSTGINVANYALFRIVTTLKIDEGVKLAEGTKILCSTHTRAAGTLIAQSTGNLRMMYPRSSETGIYGQTVEPEVLAKFASHSHLAAALEVGQDMPERYTTIQGVKLEWPEYEPTTERLEYLMPHGTPKAAIELPFYTIWKSTKVPAAQITCTIQSSDGEASVETEGKLPGISPAINEEAEEAAEEEREEAAEESGAGEESSGEAEESEGE
jgi:hypothetical protein